MTTTTVSIADPATVPDGQLAAFNPAELDMSANSRTDAEGSVTAADVASAKAHAGLAEHGCGNEVPIEIRRRPDGSLRVRDGHRRAIMCQRAGVPVHRVSSPVPKVTNGPTCAAGCSASGSPTITASPPVGRRHEPATGPVR